MNKNYIHFANRKKFLKGTIPSKKKTCNAEPSDFWIHVYQNNGNHFVFLFFCLFAEIRFRIL